MSVQSQPVVASVVRHTDIAAGVEPMSISHEVITGGETPDDQYNVAAAGGALPVLPSGFNRSHDHFVMATFVYFLLGSIAAIEFFSLSDLIDGSAMMELGAVYAIYSLRFAAPVHLGDEQGRL